MQVSICYALPQQQYLEVVDVADACTLEEAIATSRLLEVFPDFDLNLHGFGIYAKLSKRDAIVKEGDRIEIYRPLPRKPRDPHAMAEKKARIKAKKLIT
ncbi:MAG: RnfH family protein [Mariprofundaceae bacterium]|nr:RnfH family protein [Mariprofundaceae bacterium]